MMKKILTSLMLLMGIATSIESQVTLETHAFLSKDLQNNHILIQEGKIAKRYSPCSTFKIFLSLIGFEEKILIDEQSPVWPFKPEYEAFLESWKDPQNPTSWMKNSCVWYSQVLTKLLGMEKFKCYVTKFSYGNMDLSGDTGQNNGLTNAWLSSSLEISPLEQLMFLENLLNGKLPVGEHARDMTKKILFVEELKNGWHLYGKTGSGYLLNEKREKTQIKHGWFIGWIEKEGRKIIFVHHIEDAKVEEGHAGPRAKEQAKIKLIKMITQFEGEK
jgi:beta-lactamase class D